MQEYKYETLMDKKNKAIETLADIYNILQLTQDKIDEFTFYRQNYINIDLKKHILIKKLEKHLLDERETIKTDIAVYTNIIRFVKPR